MLATIFKMRTFSQEQCKEQAGLMHVGAKSEQVS